MRSAFVVLVLVFLAVGCKRAIPALETSCDTASDCTTVIFQDDDCCQQCVHVIANRRSVEARSLACKAHTMTKPCATPTCGFAPTPPPKCLSKECVPDRY